MSVVLQLHLTEDEKRRLGRVFEDVEQHLARITGGRMGFLPEADGEDVVHEVFPAFARKAVCGELECLDNRRIADIEDDELDQYILRCRTYLIDIAIHKCGEFHRKARSHRRAKGRWCQTRRPKRRWHETRREQKADPAVELDRQEQSNRVRQAVANLPKHLYKVVMLCYDEGRSHKEAAVILGVSLSTAEHRLHDALVLLRQELTQDNHNGNGHPRR